MSTLSRSPKIISMARGLGLSADEAAESILSFCRKRIAKILKSAGSIQTIWDFEKIVCDQLNLVVHEIWNDDDLRKLSLRYARDEGDSKFAALDMDLEEADTFGVIYQRNKLNRVGEFQYVAFVDCRGNKAWRRFFTRWHEIAHCLTSYEQYEFPFRRTNTTDIQKDPVEKLMDMIAGELAFTESLFKPVLKATLGQRRLTFDAAEGVRRQFCPDASAQATLNACAAHSSKPTILLEAGLALKKSQLRALQDGQLNMFPTRTPKPCLRVLRSMPNAEARKIGLQIHKQWRVPGFSVIAKVLNSDFETEIEAVENLSSWKSSDGGSLPDFDVVIQARKIQNKVVAIITLVE